ncbi:MAG: hypothetical protein OXN44_00835 [Acidimicrobiaceae bacterium]|nr:hypothetical protein [Acidimicrobiaceae bacterium]MDE0605897.1 hypothetical protein [Acidimicrobiaceae bacterium]
MSSLWTPAGEHPVDHPSTLDPGDAAEPPADDSLDDEIAAALPEGMTLDDLSPEERARAEEMVKEMADARERLISTPAATIVANHAMGLYELAALHLSAQTPNFAEATVAIDALSAIADGLAGRLGGDEEAVKQALDQIRMAFVQLKSRTEAT